MRWHPNASNTFGVTYWRTPRTLTIALGRRVLYLNL